jgi:hypothetical protein
MWRAWERTIMPTWFWYGNLKETDLGFRQEENIKLDLKESYGVD